MKKLTFILIACSLTIMFNGCSNDSKKLVGTWYRTKTISIYNIITPEAEVHMLKNATYEFMANNQLVYSYEYDKRLYPHKGEWSLIKSDSVGFPYTLILRVEGSNAEITETKNKVKFISDTEIQIVKMNKETEFYSKK